MATLEISHPHNTSLDDASKRTRALLERFRASSPELIDRVTWSSDTEGEAKGLGFTGAVKIDGATVFITAKLGLPASLIRGKIEKTIREQLAEEFKATV